jgi:hypothetical protein
VTTRRYSAWDVFWAWLFATVFSGAPSTLFFIATGEDLWPPVHAVGSMLISPGAPAWMLFLAAALVHCAVSLFWALILASFIPPARAPLYAVVASALIAVLDLRVIAPVFFPDVAALAFGPQFADHLMWGLLAGVTLKLRATRHRTN